MCARCESWGHHSLSLSCPALPDDLRHALPEVRRGMLRGQVDINTAGLDLLRTIREPIGPKRSEDIIRYRQLNGQFTAVRQLTRLNGLSHTLVNRLIGRIRMSVRDRESRPTHFVAVNSVKTKKKSRLC